MEWPLFLLEAMQDTPGLSFEVVPSLMKWDAIPDASVDLFVSSHAVEHLADPCPWMEGQLSSMLEKPSTPFGIWIHKHSLRAERRDHSPVLVQ